MFSKRLFSEVEKSRKYILLNVLSQWISLICNIGSIYLITNWINDLLQKKSTLQTGIYVLIGLLILLCIRFFVSQKTTHMSFLASKEVKLVLREKILAKLYRLGITYRQQVATSEVVLVAVEGVEQLESYFGLYLPQFFYAMLAPLTLFFVLAQIHLPVAFVLLICVPLIPIAIALVQTWAKKLFSKYWGQYNTLGDTFLENLQGLTTLKIYQADAAKNEQMNKEAESFRQVTMAVLRMQLNSITIMDLIAYGGAALGILFIIPAFQANLVNFGQALMVILLSAEFFIPMRQLGSYFHIAMNGIGASERIFKLLDAPEPPEKNKRQPLKHLNIEFKNTSFQYDESRPIIKNLSCQLLENSFVGIVGESGSGKSTLAALLMGHYTIQQGHLTIGQQPLHKLSDQQHLEIFSLVSHESYLFKGSVRDNLQIAKPSATDQQLWQVLEKTNLAAFFKEEEGLDTPIETAGQNLSGGQRQRLTLARVLLYDSDIIIFDEATSNIDAESEADILKVIHELTQTKTIIFISHRLANVQQADQILVLKNGELVEQGTHQQLLSNNKHYCELWDTQQQLEQVLKKGVQYA